MTRVDFWAKMPRYVKRVAVGFDEFANTVLDGKVGECVSSRVGKNIKEGEWWSVHVFGPIIDLIFGNDHCINNIENSQTDHE